MPKTRIQKEETVTKLKEKLERAKLIAFADYRGLTMSQLSDLRNKLRDTGGEFSITKNTLIKVANPSTKDDLISGPTAILFSFEDEISPLKVLVKALKEAGIGKIKGGQMGDMELDSNSIIKLSTLPTKDELRAKTVGILVAPLQGMVGVLQANLRNLVYALHLIEDQKKGSASAS